MKKTLPYIAIPLPIRGLLFAVIISNASGPVRPADQDTFKLEETLAEQKKREKNAETGVLPAGDPSQAAWAFFELCANGKFREALDSAAPILRSRLDVTRLESALAQLGLKTAALFTWKKEKTFHDMAAVEGAYTPNPGKVIRLLVTLVRDDAAWQLYSACILPASASAPLLPLFAPALPADAARAPDEKTIRAFVQADLRFFTGVQESDHFRELYHSSGGRARKKPVETWEMLARLRDRDLTPSRALEAPIHFDKATSIGPDGVCIANVHVDISPLQLRISYRFILAAEGWRFGGKDGQLVPDSTELQRLSRKALLRFADAVQRRSFVEFHKGISESWKAQVTPEQLATAFRGFIEKDVKLDGLANAPILIDSGPSEDSEGIIHYSGRCETKPHETMFTLKYWHENGEWGLFGMDVALRDP